MNIIKKLFKVEMSEEEKLFNRVNSLMSIVYGKENHNHKPEIIRELFNLHNEIFEAKEYSVSCGGCRMRVYNKVKEWWHSKKQIYIK